MVNGDLHPRKETQIVDEDKNLKLLGIVHECTHVLSLIVLYAPIQHAKCETPLSFTFTAACIDVHSFTPGVTAYKVSANFTRALATASL